MWTFAVLVSLLLCMLIIMRFCRLRQIILMIYTNLNQMFYIINEIEEVFNSYNPSKFLGQKGRGRNYIQSFHSYTV